MTAGDRLQLEEHESGRGRSNRGATALGGATSSHVQQVAANNCRGLRRGPLKRRYQPPYAKDGGSRDSPPKHQRTGRSGGDDKEPPPGVNVTCFDDSDPNAPPFDLEHELSLRVGQAEIKEQLLAFRHEIMLDRRRRDLGMDISDAVFPHMLFLGPPGCGKTSMARLVARILSSFGNLEQGKLVECQRASLVAGVIGQTAIKTREVIAAAKGGVLFVDEAYRLAPPGSEKDYGREAVDELMSEMEKGDPVMIFAGYNDDNMREFVRLNPGIFRRIQRVFEFKPFTVNELAQIIVTKATKKKFNVQMDVPALGALLKEHTSEEQRSRMNGGLCDTLLRATKRHLDRRCGFSATLEELSTYKDEDFIAACGDLPKGDLLDQAAS